MNVLLSKLGIDWKLLIAQIVNFAILIGALTYFVYRPLLDLLDRRSERVRKAMEEARRIETQNKEMEAIRFEQLTKIDWESGVMLERAKQHAEKLAADIMSSAQKEARELLAKTRAVIAEERAAIIRNAQATLATIILKATERIIEREFEPGDQKRLLETIADELPTLIHEARL